MDIFSVDAQLCGGTTEEGRGRDNPSLRGSCVSVHWHQMPGASNLFPVVIGSCWRATAALGSMSVRPEEQPHGQNWSSAWNRKMGVGGRMWLWGSSGKWFCPKISVYLGWKGVLLQWLRQECWCHREREQSLIVCHIELGTGCCA